MNYLRKLQLCRDAGDSPAGNPAGAEGAGAGTDGGTSDQDNGGQQGAEGNPAGSEVKTFTQADIDRIVQQTIVKERKRAETAVQNARTEAERLAQMTAEQRAEHERQERETALAKREAELTRRELRAQALETLSGRGLPHELADVLNYADADTCNASIAGAEKAFRAAVQRGVEDRMKGTPPKSGDADPAASMLAEMRAAAGLKPTK